MTDPLVGTNNALVTDLQGQSQSSGYITVFELELPDSGIGGTGIDKLFFHDGRSGASERYFQFKTQHGASSESIFRVKPGGGVVLNAGHSKLNFINIQKI